MSPSPYIPRGTVHRPGASLLTVPEVAAELRVSRMTVYRLIHSNTIPALRIGRNFRVAESALDNYVRTCAAEFWEAPEVEEA